MGKLRHGGIVVAGQAVSGAVGAEPGAKRVQTPSPTAALGLRGQIPAWGNVWLSPASQADPRIPDDVEGEVLG